ncbi:Tannase and feruloyl esterase-like protein 2 [Elsinoe fawcettii]|nr:Tannase and feruloyl esterase-like protein 2 [Elsinoe fawcettii]
MVRPILFSLLSLAPAASAVLDCTEEAFAPLLPSNARIVQTRKLADNSTFEVPASNIAYPRSPVGLPALCAVQVNVVSSNSSAFEFGLFLPDRWNNRFIAVGNGGFAGGINWLDVGQVVRYGFASISTDTGHNSTSGDITWALNQEEKKNDWGYRALHGSVVIAKDLTEAYYGSAPTYNYYSGCSTGGRQGLRDLQLYPEDFDGVLAGAPAWWTYHLQTWTVKAGTYNLPVDGPGRIDPSLFPFIEREIQRQCDAQDGLRDSIISDPRGCNLYLDALLCPATPTNTTCLTVPQIQTLTNIYTDYIDTNQTFVFPRVEPGSEATFSVLFGGSAPNPLGLQYVQYFLLNDPTWDYRDFSLATVQLAERVDPGDATADDFDLRPFKERGGKLLMYHGLGDSFISTGSSEVFYNNVRRTLLPQGATVDDFFRLFFVPGMLHCGQTSDVASAPWYFAGAGQAGDLAQDGVFSVPGFVDPKHDALLALMEWTEKGTAPDSLIATRFRNDSVTAGVERQRPICVFPKQARFRGGNANDAENWVCDEISNGVGVQMQEGY